MAAIGKIRENVGLLVFVIAGAIVAFLFMDAMSSASRGSVDPNLLGHIDGEPLSRTTYETKVKQLEDNYNQSGIPIDDKTRFQIREQAWQQYLQEKLSERAYDDLGLTVPNAEFKDVLFAHPGIVNAEIFKGDDGQFSKAKLDEYLASLNLSPEDAGYSNAQAQRRQFKSFEQSVYQGQLREKYNTLVNKAVYVPSWFAKQDYAEKNSKAQIRFVQMPYTSIDESEISFTDSDLMAYMKARPNEFKQKEETRSVDFVIFPINPSAADTVGAETYVKDRLAAFKSAEDNERYLRMQYSETAFNPAYMSKSNLAAKPEIKDSLFVVPEGTVIGPYYEGGTYKAVKLIGRKMIADSAKIRVIVKQANATTPFTRTQEIVDSLKTVLRNGGDFEALASAFSDDASKESGGEMEGYIKPGQFRGLPALDNAIFYEHKEGDLFTVQTAQGSHLVEILDADANTQAVQIATLTRNIEATKATRDEAYAIANSFVASNRSMDSFAAAATEQGLNVQSAAGLTQNAYDISGLGVSREIVTWAYQAKAGDVIDKVLQVDQTLPGDRTLERYVVAGLKATNEAGLEPLENVRSRVETAVKQEKQAAKIKEKIGSAASLDAVASQMGVEVSTASDVDFASFSPSGLGPEPKVQAAVFAIQPNTMSKPISGSRGVYVVEVSSINAAGEPTDLVSAKKAAATQLSQRVNSVFSSIVDKSEVEDLRLNTRTY
ncbi:MAG: SurA N-terminal domain-containing protein [Chitinophagales bacterium]